jgi:putative ATP-binding cassette transporter
MASTGRSTWSRFLAIATPFFRSDQRWRAWGMFGLLLVLLLGITGLNVVNSYVGRDFMTAVADRDTGRVGPLALLYLCVFAASTVVAVYERFTEQHLGLFWRRWLTLYLTDRYLSGQAYYRLNNRGDIDNPDQRIAEDVNTFSTNALSFTIIIVNSTITLCAFAGILWSITPWLLLAAVAYAAFGTLITILLGHRLVGLNYQQLKKQADLRYELIRVREYAEPLALQHAERAPRRRIAVALERVVDNFKGIIAVSRNLGFFTNGYNYLTQLIPLVIVAPLYLRREVEFGVVTQAAMAFSMVMNAFSVFVEQFQALSSFAAVIHRLGSLREEIDQRPAPAPPVIEVVYDGDQVAFEGLTLRTSEGRVLVRDLSLEVPRGKRLLIRGSNGCGRTCLFRAAAGLWEHGSGRILRPPRGELMFLPQHPYLVPGPLRDQFLWSRREAGFTDEQILEVLRKVRFEQVLERVGGLDAERDWPKVLSPGEQLLLALGRLLLAEPHFAFLDEALGVFEPPRRRYLYGILSESPITYLTAGNEPDLVEYHDMILEVQAGGAWRSAPILRPAAAVNGPQRAALTS